jgi:hypothetical protein
MRKFLTITLVSLLVATCIHAQKIKFTSINAIGILSGESKSKLSIETINGIKYKSWSTGIGIAYDSYGHASIPLFLDVRKTFGKKNVQPLLYVDAGINIELYNDDIPSKTSWGNSQGYAPFYGEAGGGVSFKLKKQKALNLTAGYSYKHLKYAIAVPSFSSLYPSAPATMMLDYEYRRISIKLALQF